MPAKLLIKIQQLRQEMENLIKEKGSLLDSSVLTASKALDEILTKYENIIKKRRD